jgi:hypothetical protein
MAFKERPSLAAQVDPLGSPRVWRPVESTGGRALVCRAGQGQALA